TGRRGTPIERSRACRAPGHPSTWPRSLRLPLLGLTPPREELPRPRPQAVPQRVRQLAPVPLRHRLDDALAEVLHAVAVVHDHALDGLPVDLAHFASWWSRLAASVGQSGQPRS